MHKLLRLAIYRLKWPLPVPPLKQQYTSCMKVGSGGNLDLSREYPKRLFVKLAYGVEHRLLEFSCLFFFFFWGGGGG